MKLKILWPGKSRNENIRDLQALYLGRINQIEKCDLVETRAAKGVSERFVSRIKEIEAAGLEKHFKDDYIVCLFHKGKEMNSIEFARFLEKTASDSIRTITFVVGGFLGLDERILNRANSLFSISKMTFSHELCRVILLEQIYRSLTILRGMHYAK
ncbi:23S rRNA (pseudouridine(1915)-N(3))-methyltransferase RlmH [Acidobacteriota bacterium]